MDITEFFKGAWLVYHYDWSQMVIFGSEIDALRHAVEHDMKVRYVQWGEEFRQ